MTKRMAHKLTIYRRHAASCAVTTKLDACDCPIWIHGKVRGRFVRESLQTRSLASAIMRKDDMLRGGGDDPPSGGGLALVATQTPKDITLTFAAQEFNASKGRKASSTRELYARAVEHFVRYADAHEIVLLRHVETTLVRNYFAAFDGEWKRNTAQSRLIQLRVFFNYCKARRWLQFTPTADRDLNYSRTSATTSERLPFTPAEVTSILAAIERMPADERDRARALVLLLLYTGMRISDATFFERSSLTEQQIADYHVIKTRRPISLPPEVHPRAVDALAKLPASRTYFFQPDQADDYHEARAALRGGREFSQFMPDYKGRVRETTALVLKVLALAGLSGACHRFRDTFAINMLAGDGEKGADIYTVSKMLGHSDVKITDAHYMKLLPGYRERMSRSTRVLSYQFPRAG